MSPEWASDFRSYININMTTTTPVLEFVSPTPSPLDHVIGDWIISKTVSSGSSGVVSTAKNIKTARLYAVKRYKHERSRASSIAEIDILKLYVPKHVS